MTDNEGVSDSFVDIIANTLAVVIIMTILTATMTRRKNDQTGAALIEDLRRKTEQTQNSLASLTRKRRKLKSSRQALVSRRDDMLQDIGVRVSRRQKTLQQNRDALAALEKERERLKTELQTTREAVAEEADIDAETLEAYEQSGPAELTRRLTQLEQQQQALRDRLGGNTDLQELQARKRDLADFNSVMRGRIDRFQPGDTVMVRHGETDGSPRRQQPVWVECFVGGVADEEREVPLPQVRLVNQRNYRRQGNRLLPVKPGEPVDEALSEGSDFYRLVHGKDESFRETHYFYLVVRPEAYDVFRQVREHLWNAGWRVRWDPLASGTAIRIGPDPRGLAGARSVPAASAPTIGRASGE